MSNEVVACTLNSRDLASQAERWRRLRAAAGLERVETDAGFRQTFRDAEGVEDELRALAAAENDCCAWARWEVGRENGAIVVEVSSTGAGVTALHGMFTADGRRPSRVR
jgi:hypothetical protein